MKSYFHNVHIYSLTFLETKNVYRDFEEHSVQLTAVHEHKSYIVKFCATGC